MMGRRNWMTGALMGAALAVGGAAMAQTQPLPDEPEAGEWQGGESYDSGDDAASAEDNRAQQQSVRPEEDFSDVVAADEQQRGGASAWSGARQAQTSPYGERDEESEAMTACAVAARTEAERDGGYAEVRGLDTPRESRNGFTIDGELEARSGWDARDGRSRQFTCTVANGRVEDVFFQRERGRR